MGRNIGLRLIMSKAPGIEPCMLHALGFLRGAQPFVDLLHHHCPLSATDLEEMEFFPGIFDSALILSSLVIWPTRLALFGDNIGDFFQQMGRKLVLYLNITFSSGKCNHHLHFVCDCH